MKNNFYFAFEVSDNTAQYAHMLPLLHECILDSSIYITLYSSKNIFFEKIKELYLTTYPSSSFKKIQFKIIDDNRLNKIKKTVLYGITKLHLSKLTPTIRKFFLKVKSSETTEDYSNYYKANASFFLKQDIVLTTELKGGQWIVSSPTKLVWLLHGIISNENPYFKNWKCDIVISPQIGLKDKLLHKTPLDKNTIFYQNAYLKKDIIDFFKPKNELFNNKNKNFIYNPHWDNGLNQSSWFEYGIDILDFFSKNKQYNLIFAPHILLDKFYQIKIPEKYRELDNIIIDTTSQNLINGAYIGCADYYIGDVSSQFFEFALCNNRIKPIFINTSRMDWKKNSIYSYWNTGVVINNINELSSAIEASKVNKPDFSKFFKQIPLNQSKQLLDFLKKQLSH